jgi:hypothetical protein
MSQKRPAFWGLSPLAQKSEQPPIPGKDACLTQLRAKTIILIVSYIANEPFPRPNIWQNSARIAVFAIE